MTLSEIYNKAYREHSGAPAEERAFDLSLLFEHCFGISRYRLPIVGGKPADGAKASAFFALYERYMAGEPLQYLLGEWAFYGLPFAVGEGVLIPRQDTETLVETALSLLKDTPAPRVADLCAGSGCVAIAISHERSDARVFALELSDAALPYLTANIARNSASVEPLQCDVLAPSPLPPLDLVVSNPPYIPRNEMETLQLQVTHEPKMALAGGEDGYDFYRALPAIYRPLLKSGGALAFEVGYNQAETVAALLADAGYAEICITNDLAGIARVVSGRCL